MHKCNAVKANLRGLHFKLRQHLKNSTFYQLFGEKIELYAEKITKTQKTTFLENPNYKRVKVQLHY